MDNSSEIRTFLRSRRDRVTPEQAGLPVYGNRRVSGLRRGELAMLAGVSVEYYTRMERGNLSGVSDSVLDAVAGALRLNETERDHLYALARAANTSPARARRRSVRSTVRPSIERIVNGMPDLPAFVRNNRFDVLAANPLARALHCEWFDGGVAEPVNTVRFVFLDPRAASFYGDWERVARQGVGSLRVEVAKNPYDRELSNLIGELSTRSDVFRKMWGAHDVHVYNEGTKRFRHPVVGDLELVHEALALPAPGDTGLSITVYSAEPGTPSEDALRLLASWAATSQDASVAPADADDR
ncbi:helix-turn-helix transcriptional regulator [Streptomyces arenae]|uniref:helix-turn-helix transcriptional regulator n=1 Tax=Streptomyces arenae TaxID=29301 RepID=UPI002657CC3D|nr:helix-turn-helix transcriptional regulator [Streptomyces arenae]MCG7210129.1 helix-turn-helix transcriptional regulator [Streptomyces arenae]